MPDPAHTAARVSESRTVIASAALLSLEPWDEVWRRNQHLASRLVQRGDIGRLLFVEPPGGGLRLRAGRRRPMPGIDVLTPPLVVPRRYGGHRVLAAWLRRQIAGVDLLWINDPVAGAGALRPGVRAVYDVTDDWRSMPQRPADRARVVAAEDVLARRAQTVVCSDQLARRWGERYGIGAAVVQNGVDVEAIRNAVPRPLDGASPHVVYVGTLHENRLDVDLVAVLAADPRIGTVHLVGPNHLAAASHDRLIAAGVRVHGPQPFAEVPSWLVAADVLICPHVVDDFTLSLDAIKAHEYLATDKPVVATPTSGFQLINARGLKVTARATFVDAVPELLGNGAAARMPAAQWDARAAEFVAQLESR